MTYKFLYKSIELDDIMSDFLDLEERINEHSERGYQLDDIIHIQESGTTTLLVAIMKIEEPSELGF